MADSPGADSNKDDAEKDSHQEILSAARERFKLAAEAEADIRRDALDDLEFSAGNQWPENIKNARAIESRPCLVINRLPQFIRQITNDQRQNRPSIKVGPVDDGADIETAKIFQGLIRHIEYNSNADVAYDTAFESAVRGGRGFFRIVPEFSDPMSFEQELVIKRVRNPFTVYMDPAAKEPDGSDMNWCFIVEDLLKDELEKQFPDSELASMDDFASIGDQAPDWMPGGKVRIAEYLYKEFKEMELVLLSDGSVRPAHLAENLAEGVTEIRRRKAQVPVIKWCKLNAVEVLEETTWVGQWIPVIPVYGEELDVNGKLILSGVVRNAKDSQRMYNYWASSETEMIALAPRAPFIGAEGQFEGHEAQWQTANTKNHAYLQYKAKSIDGTPIGPPQRQVYEPAVQAITAARGQAAEDLKATTGIYDAALGNRSNENSGVAIQRRNQQSQTSNFHFVDNLTRSLRHAGRILLDAIPRIYDTPRTARIIGEDGQTQIVLINQALGQGVDQKQAHYLSVGKYDATVSTGPSYETKRQEAVASMLDLAKVAPQISQACTDILVRNMDIPQAQEIADRLKKMLPPGIADDDKNKQPLPPQVQQQMQQMGSMIDALTKQLHAAHDKLDSGMPAIESKERIAMAQIQAEIEIAMAKMGSQEAQSLLAHQVSEIQHRLDLLHSAYAIGADATNDAEAQAADHAHQMAMQPPQQDLGNAGPAGAVPSQSMPTGGPSPGNSMGNQP